MVWRETSCDDEEEFLWQRPSEKRSCKRDKTKHEQPRPNTKRVKSKALLECNSKHTIRQKPWKAAQDQKQEETRNEHQTRHDNSIHPAPSCSLSDSNSKTQFLERLIFPLNKTPETQKDVVKRFCDPGTKPN